MSLRALYLKYQTDPGLTWFVDNSCVFVPGDGLMRPALMFIGEAPGASEAREGRPFVGASGKFLNSLLASIGYNRDLAFITNIVKFRPPKNRDPEPDEIAASLPYLAQEIQMVSPQALVTLGRFAADTIMPGVKLSASHGCLLETARGLPFVPLYHPAVALYNPKMRGQLFKDFATLKELI